MTTKHKLHTKEQVKLGNRINASILIATIIVWIPIGIIGLILISLGESIDSLIDYLDNKVSDFSYWLARKTKK